MDARTEQDSEQLALQALQALIVESMGKPRLSPRFNGKGELVCNLERGTIIGLNDLLYELMQADPHFLSRETNDDHPVKVSSLIESLIKFQIKNKQLYEKYDRLLSDLQAYIFNREWKYINFLGYEYSISLARGHSSAYLPPNVKKQREEIFAYINQGDDPQENPYHVFTRIKNIALSPEAREDIKYWSDDLKKYYDAFIVQPDENIFPNTLPNVLKTP